ncbi:hypothetical protein M747DRAFT_127830 [Aspergillus niger ATCC 13496]|uniref:Uncharacterized protein n=1 Tax=Aspergillus niger ATCC 13496 TaxID=1353008 RepID=A0A370BQJ2_ASPNG|nr:hypothetical protein M747DRAFT_127830 [Aspergillus niger ATCC 13496]
MPKDQAVKIRALLPCMYLAFSTNEIPRSVCWLIQLPKLGQTSQRTMSGETRLLLLECSRWSSSGDMTCSKQPDRRIILPAISTRFSSMAGSFALLGI